MYRRHNCHVADEGCCDNKNLKLLLLHIAPHYCRQTAAINDGAGSDDRGERLDYPARGVVA